MKRKGWYLVAYDISAPNRLLRIHRLLKKEGLALQKSIFLVYCSETMMNNILDHIALIIDPDIDDIRAYPIVGPHAIWANRRVPLADYPLFHFSDENNVRLDNKQKRTFWRKILFWLK